MESKVVIDKYGFLNSNLFIINDVILAIRLIFNLKFSVLVCTLKI